MKIAKSPRRTSSSASAVTSMHARSIEILPAIGQRFPAMTADVPRLSSEPLAARNSPSA
jgi:hypothetical protein